jgi:hypothetical protein
MIESLTFKMTHDASAETTPAFVGRDMHAGQFGDTVSKEPDATAANRFLLGDSGDQKSIGKH